MLVAIESLNTLLKDVVRLDAFEIGYKSNTASIPFSEVSIRTGRNFIARIRNLEVFFPIAVFWKSSHYNLRSLGSVAAIHLWERPASKSLVKDRWRAHGETGSEESRRIYGFNFLAIFIIISNFRGSRISILLRLL